mmetsp:Transcript_17679/g.54901  ORF Transcript_17679/g.54901 Transcript_17679/m.54901 type:complete len:251 (+) Transcript_17679:338-1090(+)
MTSGMLICTARIHSGENFSQWCRQTPRGALLSAATRLTAASRVASACGRSARTGGVAASAARAITTGRGQRRLSRGAPPRAGSVTSPVDASARCSLATGHFEPFLKRPSYSTSPSTEAGRVAASGAGGMLAEAETLILCLAPPPRVPAPARGALRGGVGGSGRLLCSLRSSRGLKSSPPPPPAPPVAPRLMHATGGVGQGVWVGTSAARGTLPPCTCAASASTDLMPSGKSDGGRLPCRASTRAMKGQPP